MEEIDVVAYFIPRKYFCCFCCQTDVTPQIRNGFLINIPYINKSHKINLCNACGLRYNKTFQYCFRCNRIPHRKCNEFICEVCEKGDMCRFVHPDEVLTVPI